MSHRRVDGREDNMVKSMVIALYGERRIDKGRAAGLRRGCQASARSWLP
jgi:hypothetical protein